MVDTKKLKITSFYGYRKRFGRKHRGVDLRSWRGAKRLNIILPAECIFVRSVKQKKWGWTHVFMPTSGPADEIKFIHVDNNIMKTFTVGNVFQKGCVIGQTCLTKYMVRKKLGEHLHFETWKKGKPFNPIEFIKYFGLDYE